MLAARIETVIQKSKTRRPECHLFDGVSGARLVPAQMPDKSPQILELFLWPLDCKMQCMEQASLTRIELNKFEVILNARIAELEHALRRRDLIAVEPSADQVDEVQQASHLALAISHFDQESHQLRDARGALRRIQEGTFGVCEQCEEDIHFKRLLAVPWTAFCIHCQEELDRDRKDMSGVSDADTDQGDFFRWAEAA